MPIFETCYKAPIGDLAYLGPSGFPLKAETIYWAVLSCQRVPLSLYENKPAPVSAPGQFCSHRLAK
jgi:hypothetical protein